MPKRVTLQPAGKQFHVEQHETITEAGLRHGLNLPSNCANGTCGDCRSRLASGRIEPTRYHDYRFSIMEREEGWYLACSNRPLTDLEIRIDLTDTPSDIPQQRIAAKVSKVVPLTDSIVQLQLRTAELEHADCWRELLKHGRRVTVQGPCGNFVMNEASKRPLLFIARDTGFAQIEA